MAVIREQARAKITLTLDVAGRRGDGLHEIASLVAFASVGDVVTLDPSEPVGVAVSGPFAAALAGENILARALGLLGALAPQLTLGAVHLEKLLPVASGIGGGSADAAALLRAVRQASGAAGAAIDWAAFARQLGADVAVCLESRALWMTGVGERLADLSEPLPVLHAILVNPQAAVPADKTVQVYRALSAGPLDPAYVSPVPPRLGDGAGLLAFMRVRGNGLTRAALAVVPEAGAVLAVLSAQPDVAYVALSGGGPTCFAVFPDAAAADAARARIAAAHPDWWVAAVTLA